MPNNKERDDKPTVEPAIDAAVDAAFDQALDLDGDEREQFLDSLPAMQQKQLVELLAALEEAGPLDTPLADVAGNLLELASESENSAVEPIGRRIGDWRVLERLGAGGMGVVYLAERVGEDFEQRAALKIIRWELADSLLVRRFLAERRIVAQLSHPHIAGLIDGGVTDGGLPYLVLEYVDGEPIDAYCDQRELGREPRLRLMVEIARAVDVAHRQLIVHRDLKPSNVLVRPDGVPKLVDFGVAKLLDDADAESGAEPTRFAPMTPSYASPEQRRGETAGIASDVYSLGIVLAQLVTGQPPSVEEDSAASGTAENGMRATGERLDGDLANIVARATAAEPERRYRSAAALADDLERLLDGRPVEATPPSFSYRFGKWLRRHRAAAILVTVIGLVGATGIVWQALEARAERDRARLEAAKAEQVSSFLISLFQTAAPQVGEEPSVRAMLDHGAERIRDELQDAPRQRASVLRTLGDTYRWLHEYDRAEQLIGEALEIEKRLSPSGIGHAVALQMLGGVQLARGHAESAEASYRQALDLLAQSGEAAEENRASLLNSIAMTRLRRDPAGAVELLERSVEIYRSLDDADGLAMARGNLGLAYDNLGRFRKGEAQHRAAIKIYGNKMPSNSTRATVLNNLANCLAAQGRLDEAISAIEEALKLRRSGPAPGLNIAEAEANLALLLITAGRSKEAVELAERAVAVLDAVKPESTNAIATRANFGWALALEAEHDRALPILQRVSEQLIERFGDDHLLAARGRTRFGAALLRAGRPGEARPVLESAVRRYRASGNGGLALADVLLAFGTLACDGEAAGRADGLDALGEAVTIYAETANGPSWLLEHARIERARCQQALGQDWDPVEAEAARVELEHLRGAESWSVVRAEKLLQPSPD